MSHDRHFKVVWPAAVLLAAVAAAIPAGCATKAPTPGAETNVKFAMPAKGGDKTKSCYDLDRHPVGWLAWAKASEGRRPFALSLAPGSLLAFDDSGDLLYVYRGDEAQPIELAREGPAILLNGRPVCLDMREDGAVEWLNRQPKSRLASIRSVCLAGMKDRDLAVLALFGRSGIMVVSPRPYPAEGRAEAEIAEAILAVEPTGLILPEPAGFERLLEEAAGLTHLWWGGPELPDLSKCRNLRFFAQTFTESQEQEPDLRPLADLPHLRTLFLEDCQAVRDFAPIGKLRQLQYLVLGRAKHLRDLAAFGRMDKLRSLCLIKCDQLTDISAVTKLTGLSYLTLTRTSQIEDLGPLARLKKLKVLVVEPGDLDNRRQEYDKLREELPDTEIVGFCLGSAWIVPVLVLGGIHGRLRRRGRVHAKAAR